MNYSHTSSNRGTLTLSNGSASINYSGGTSQQVNGGGGALYYGSTNSIVVNSVT